MGRSPATSSRVSVPASVWALGVVSLLMDVSTEIIQTLLPIFMVVGLGASATMVGLVEGFAVLTATVVKFGAGFIADRTSRPKWLAVAGYGLSAASKLVFPLAASVAGVALGKGLDRIGKGIRTAPRDAIVAAVTPAEIRGRAFGLRKSLDAAGGFIGPLAAIALMALFMGDVRAVFWVAAIPAVAAILVLVFAVSDPPAPADAKAPPSLAGALGLSAATWTVIGVASLIGLARFSEAFLLLKGVQVGVPTTLAPSAIILLHLVFGLAAFPVGVLSDRIGRNLLLVLSLAFLVVADVLLAVAGNAVVYFVGVAFWGLHMGFSQGLLAALIGDVAPRHMRGSAFGVFALVSGLVAFAGNLAAGLLWDGFGPAVTFGVGAALSLCCGLAVAVWARPTGRSQR